LLAKQDYETRFSLVDEIGERYCLKHAIVVKPPPLYSISP